MKTDILNDSEWEVTQALRSGGSSLVDFSFVAISFSYIMLTSAIESLKLRTVRSPIPIRRE